MSWDYSDLENIRKHLGITAKQTDLLELQRCLDYIATHSPDSVETCQEILSKLDTAQSTLETMLSDPNFSLVEADVIRFQEGAKVSGLEKLIAGFKEQLVLTLDIGHLIPSWGVSFTSLYRS